MEPVWVAATMNENIQHERASTKGVLRRNSVRVLEHPALVECGRNEADNADLIYRHAREGGFPADLVAEIKSTFGPGTAIQTA